MEDWLDLMLTLVVVVPLLFLGAWFISLVRDHRAGGKANQQQRAGGNYSSPYPLTAEEYERRTLATLRPPGPAKGGQ